MAEFELSEQQKLEIRALLERINRTELPVEYSLRREYPLAFDDELSAMIEYAKLLVNGQKQSVKLKEERFCINHISTTGIRYCSSCNAWYCKWCLDLEQNGQYSCKVHDRVTFIDKKVESIQVATRVVLNSIEILKSKDSLVLANSAGKNSSEWRKSIDNWKIKTGYRALESYKQSKKSIEEWVEETYPSTINDAKVAMVQGVKELLAGPPIKPSFADFGITQEDLDCVQRERNALISFNERFQWIFWTLGCGGVYLYFVEHYGAWPVLPIASFLAYHWIKPKINWHVVERVVPFETARDSYNAKIRRIENEERRTKKGFWKQLKPLDFEKEVAKVYEKQGFGYRLTSHSNDRGVDIFLTDGTIIQCKHQEVPVAPKIVRELYGAMMHEKAPRAILVSSGGFSKNCVQWTEGKPIVLIDLDGLIAMQMKIKSSVMNV